MALIPELEGPGHSSAMRRSDPFFDGGGGSTPQGGGVMNVTNDDVYTAMTRIVGEMADIFSTSPYIHVGCDETSTPESMPGYAAFAKEHGIKSGSDLFAYYVKYMVDAVSAAGKKAMVWGPASLSRLNPDDAVIMIWQGDVGAAKTATDLGLKVINCPNTGSNMTAE